METQPNPAHAAAAGLTATQARLAIKTLEITKRREISAEEFELIELRYQHALALMRLEDLFVEGRLNCF